MISSHTVVFPEAVPPATPMKNGWLRLVRHPLEGTVGHQALNQAEKLLATKGNTEMRPSYYSDHFCGGVVGAAPYLLVRLDEFSP